MKLLVILLTILLALILLIWLTLEIKPKSFSPLSTSNRSTNTNPLPDSLPSPVHKFYSQLYDGGIPVIESAVLAGRAKMRIKGITFPARFRFIHQAGQSYRHQMELTLFGFPIMKVNEYYIDGNATLELPFGTIENEPKVNQGANLALWGEAIWFPSIYLTDSRVQWESVDDETAILKVPFEKEHQQILVRFNPETGMPQFMEAMRFKEANDEQKTLWIIETKDWKPINGQMACSVAEITWFDDGSPWAIFNVEEVEYNVNVEEV